MKETGIIMSGNHPKLVLDGTKTITRRTYGLKKINKDPDRYTTPEVYKSVTGDWFAWFGDKESSTPMLVKCPYGGVGDRLWVRATWSKNFKGQLLFKYQYEELTTMFSSDDRPDWLPSLAPWPKLKWKPAIHLLKEDANIWLEITRASAERVQQISEDDIEKEGVSWSPLDSGENYDTISAVENFAILWDSLNAKRGLSFDFNPWVWPISFKVIEDKTVR